MAKAHTEKSDKDLHKELHDLEESLRVFRFAMSGGKAKNPFEGRGLRKEIARISTELSARVQKTNI